jgi:hypothetical protein
LLGDWGSPALLSQQNNQLVKLSVHTETSPATFAFFFSALLLLLMLLFPLAPRSSRFSRSEIIQQSHLPLH